MRKVSQGVGVEDISPAFAPDRENRGCPAVRCEGLSCTTCGSGSVQLGLKSAVLGKLMAEKKGLLQSLFPHFNVEGRPGVWLQKNPHCENT